MSHFMGAYRRAFSLKLSHCVGQGVGGEGSRDSSGNCACFHLMLRSYYVASALLSCPEMYKLCQVALLQAAPTANLLPPFPCSLPLSFGVPFGPIVLSISVERSWSVLLAAAQLLSCSGSSGGCWGHLVECDSRGVISSSSSSSVQRESIYKIFQLVRKCHGNWLCLSPHCFAGGKNTSRC